MRSASVRCMIRSGSVGVEFGAAAGGEVVRVAILMVAEEYGGDGCGLEFLFAVLRVVPARKVLMIFENMKGGYRWRIIYPFETEICKRALLSR